MPLTLRTLIEQAGGVRKVARACGVTPGAVSQWMTNGRLPRSEFDFLTNYSREILKLIGIEANERTELAVRLIGRKPKQD